MERLCWAQLQAQEQQREAWLWRAGWRRSWAPRALHGGWGRAPSRLGRRRSNPHKCFSPEPRSTFGAEHFQLREPRQPSQASRQRLQTQLPHDKRQRSALGPSAAAAFCTPRSHFCGGSEALGRFGLGHLLAHELLNVLDCPSSWTRCPARSRSGSTSLGRPMIWSGATLSGGAQDSWVCAECAGRVIQLRPAHAAL